MRVIEKIRAMLADEDRNQGWLAEQLGVSQPTVHRWLQGSEPRGDKRDAINALYAKLFPDAETDGTETVVPIMGYLGAGAEVEPEFEQIPPDGLEEVAVPFPLPADMVAFKVRGTSMMPAYRPDWVIIVYREQTQPIESFYGTDAAVRTVDGRRFVKTVSRGTNGIGVNLTSFNAVAPMESMDLAWIGKIFAVLPPSSFRTIERRGGIQGQFRFKT